MASLVHLEVTYHNDASKPIFLDANLATTRLIHDTILRDLLSTTMVSEEGLEGDKMVDLDVPDVAFTVQQLSQYISKPKIVHFKVVIHVLHYLESSHAIGLFYCATTDFLLCGFTDSDWETCSISRKSVTCYADFLGSSLVSWKSMKKNTIARSNL